MRYFFTLSIVTQLRFDLPVEGRVLIKVYTAEGRVVSTLVDAQYNSGSYSEYFNTAHLARGLYYYQVTYETNNKNDIIIKTGKILLVK